MELGTRMLGYRGCRGCRGGRDELTRGARNKTSEVVGPGTKKPCSLAHVLSSARFFCVETFRCYARCVSSTKGIGLFVDARVFFCVDAGRVLLRRSASSVDAKVACSRPCARQSSRWRRFFYREGLKTRRMNMVFFLLRISRFGGGRFACMHSYARVR